MSKLPVFNVWVSSFNTQKVHYDNWFSFGQWGVIEKSLKKTYRKYNKMFDNFLAGKFTAEVVLEQLVKDGYDKTFDKIRNKPLYKCILDYSLMKSIIEEQFEKYCVFYFWAKCEWECTISSWPEDPKQTIKVDVYTQLKMNWDCFIELVFSAIGIGKK